MSSEWLKIQVAVEPPIVLYWEVILFSEVKIEVRPLYEQLVFFSSALESLPYVRMAMINVSSQWYTIGIHLGVPTNILDKFRAQSHNNLDTCLTNVIVEWLKNWRTKDGPPTWRRVIIAVSSRVGGDNPALARKIALEYKGELVSYDLVRIWCESSFERKESVE